MRIRRHSECIIARVLEIANIRELETPRPLPGALRLKREPRRHKYRVYRARAVSRSILSLSSAMSLSFAKQAYSAFNREKPRVCLIAMFAAISRPLSLAVFNHGVGRDPHIELVR